MTKIFAAVALALLTIACAPSAETEALSGRWTGVIALPGETTPVALDFSGSRDALTGRMSIEPARLLGKTLKSIQLEGRNIRFMLPANQRDVPFQGTIDEGVIRGAISAGDLSLPVTFRHIGPSPTPTYTEEELTFESHGAILQGSLLVPPGRGPHPAVVLIHGSSTPDRNDWRWYADIYAHAGFAALIYDKRDSGDGRDGGQFSAEILSDDLVAAIDALRARSDISCNRVGLWGFSQGGWVAPLAAVQRPVAFIALGSGPGVTYAEVTRFADAERLRQQGFTPTEIADAEAFQHRQDDLVRRGADASEFRALANQARSRRWWEHTTFRADVTPTDRTSRLRWIDLDLDPVVVWRQVSAPAFLAYGLKDENVPPLESGRRIQAARAQAHLPPPTIRLYPKAGHDLTDAAAFPSDVVAWSTEQLRAVPPGESCQETS